MFGATVANDDDLNVVILITRGRLLLDSLGSFTCENNKVEYASAAVVLCRVLNIMFLSKYLN